MIRTTGTIGGFYVTVRVIASTTRDTESSAMFLGQTIQFFCVGFTNKPNIQVMMDFKWRANLEPCYLLYFLSILQHQQARSQFHKDMVSCLLDETSRFLFSFKKLPYVMRTFFNYFRLQRHPGRIYSQLME